MRFLFVLVGPVALLRVVVALARAETFDAAATVALLGLLAGLCLVSLEVGRAIRRWADHRRSHDRALALDRRMSRPRRTPPRAAAEGDNMVDVDSNPAKRRRDRRDR
jgi:hypothetical protein